MLLFPNMLNNCLFLSFLLFQLVHSRSIIHSHVDAIAYLNHYGYNPQQCGHSTTSCAPTRFDFSSMLRDFQKQFKLPVTGRLDYQTRQLMNQPRCGVPDRKPRLLLEANFNIENRWDHRQLTWSFRHNDSTYAYWIDQAFRKWKEVLPQFEFKQVCATCEADIFLSLKPRTHDHERDIPDQGFDENIVGHAYFPKDGSVHFNEEMKWTHEFGKDNNMYNFFLVAVHELGHSLGYSSNGDPHSFDRSSIMFPFYSNLNKDSLFTETDRQIMQTIYPDGAPDEPPSPRRPVLKANLKWKQNAKTIAGGNGPGQNSNQLNVPYGIYVDDTQKTIYIANHQNHRIAKWDFSANKGQVVAGGKGRGDQTGQLVHPSDVIVDQQTKDLIICDKGNRRVVRWSMVDQRVKQTIISDIACYGLSMNSNGDLFVSDFKQHEVKRWRKDEKEGTVVAGGNGVGDRLNQINYPTFIFVDHNDAVYVSEYDNHRVMKWARGAKEGVVVAGGKGRGTSLSQLNHPRGVIVNEVGDVYVIDTHNHRIMCWTLGAKQGRVVLAGNGRGKGANQLNRPHSLAFDSENNLYVADTDNHRIQRFEVDRS